MPSFPRVVSILLAAGAGTRMGIPKALLPIEGIPLITRQLDTVRASRVDHAVVVVGCRAEEVIPLVAAGGGTAVVNPEWHRGQTTSLQVGIRALPARCEAFLVHPVDHAHVDVADLEALLAAWESRSDRERAILRPVCGPAFGHPVLFARGFASEFLALAPDAPGNCVYRRHRALVTCVPVENRLIAHDLDRPEDLDPTPFAPAPDRPQTP